MHLLHNLRLGQVQEIVVIFDELYHFFKNFTCKVDCVI